MKKVLSTLLLLSIVPIHNISLSKSHTTLPFALAVRNTEATYTAGATTTPTGSITSTLSGSLIIVAAAGNAFGYATDVDDDQSNTYTHVSGADCASGPAGIGSGYKGELWYATNATSGVTTVTVTYGAAGTLQTVIVMEVTGAAISSPTDGADFDDNQTGSTTVSAGTITTTVADDILVSIIATNRQSNGADSPFTLGAYKDNGDVAFGLSYYIVSATNTYSPTWTITTSGGAEGSCGSIAAFKIASSSVFPAAIINSPIRGGGYLSRSTK